MAPPENGPTADSSISF